MRGIRRTYGLVVVAGRSMEPTLRDGDRLLVHWGAAPGRRDGSPSYGCPGDRPLAVKRLLRLEPEGWWVERDNPAEGVDSWSVGAVPDADVLGLVVRRVWPLRRS